MADPGDTAPFRPRYMVSLSQPAAESVLPHDVVGLPRLFLVMLRVPAIAKACREREPAIGEPFQLRLLAFEVLRALLVRVAGSERIETYHDRIREVLAAQIAPEAVRRIHGLMVQTLVETRSDDCEALFEHYRGAATTKNASIQAGLAAAKAGTALAFDRAVFFYRHALALTPASSAAPGVEGRIRERAGHGRPAEKR